MKVYVVSSKTTRTCCGSVVDVSSGVHGRGFQRKANAVRKAKELADAAAKRLEKAEYGKDELRRVSSRDGTWRTVAYPDGELMFAVSPVTVVKGVGK